MLGRMLSRRDLMTGPVDFWEILWRWALDCASVLSLYIMGEVTRSGKVTSQSSFLPMQEFKG